MAKSRVPSGLDENSLFCSWTWTAWKEINDHYGHQTGNRALCRLARALLLCCRSIDTAARYGGDEFAIVLPETAEGAATLVSRRIRELFENDREKPRLTVSAGVASYPKDGESISLLLHAADNAPHAARRRQRKVGHSANITAESRPYWGIPMLSGTGKPGTNIEERGAQAPLSSRIR